MAWWQAVLAAVLGGSITAVGAYVGVRRNVRSNDLATAQREDAARREEWWRRFSWAIELAVKEDEKERRAGLLILAALIESDLAGEDELALIDMIPDLTLSRTFREHPPTKDVGEVE